MVTALIKINGVTGRNDNLSTGVSATLTNSNNTDVISWAWEFISIPPGSSAAILSPSSASTSFTPDVVGSYLIKLTVTGSIDSDEDTVVGAVLTPNLSIRIPAAREENQFDASQGWAEAIYDAMIALDTSAGSTHALGGSTHTSSTLAQLNSKISDATLDDAGDTRTPIVHDLSGSLHNSTTLSNLNAKISDATLDDTSSSRTPSGSASGDLFGTYPSPGVYKIRGQIVSANAPDEGSALVFTSGEWTPSSLSNNTLDQAYDEGGAGAGRSITADSGAIVINASGGSAIQLDGYLHFKETTNPTNIVDTGSIYVKDDSGDTELFFMDGAGNAVQITKDGGLDSSSTSNTLDQAYDQGGSGSGRLIITDNGAVKALVAADNPGFEVDASSFTPSLGAFYAYGGSNTVIGFLAKSSHIRTEDGYLSLKQITDPDSTPQSGLIYTKDDAGHTELYYKDNVNRVTKITEDGVVRAEGVGNKLDQAYDQGGAGAGKEIITDAGPVFFNYDGYEVARINGVIGFDPQILIPVSRDQSGYLYSSLKELNAELFYMDNYGSITEITSDGYLDTRDGVDIVGLHAQETYPSLDNIKGYVYTKFVNDELELYYTSNSGNIRITNNGGLETNLQKSYDLGRIVRINENEPIYIDGYDAYEVIRLDGYIGIGAIDSDPTALNRGTIYVKDDSGDKELFYMDNSGNIVQITKDGTLNADEIVVHNTLDECYDEGGSGLGREIIADAGPLLISASGGAGLDIDGYVELKEISDPTQLSGKGIVYVKDDSGDSELFFIDNSGRTTQITKDGLLNADEFAQHATSHISGESDEIDGDILDIDWNPSNYTPSTSPSEVSSVDHLTAHLFGIDGYLLDLGNGIATNASSISTNTSNLSSHTSNTSNPHSTDVGNLGSGTLAELNSIITDATLIDISHLDSYLALDGSDSMSGNLDLGGNSITNVDLVDGYNLESQFQEIFNDDAYQQGQLTEINSDLISHTSNTSNPHSTDVGNLGSGTLAELNSIITDATLIDISYLDSYLALDGSDSMSGNLDLGGNSITNVDLVDGYNLESQFQEIFNDDAYQQGQLTEINSDLISHTSNTSNPHSTDVGNLGSGTLAELNSIITDATLIDKTELDAYASVNHNATHISNGSDEIDGDILDIDWNPSNYIPSTSPSEVSSVDHLTAHLFGIDGYLLDLGNEIATNASSISTNTSNLSSHTSNTSNPHSTTMDQVYDASGSGSGRTINADSGPVFINAGGNDALELDGYLTLGETTDPSNLGNAGIAYVKDIDGYSELHVMDNFGNIIQLTSRGFVYNLFPEYAVSQLPSADPPGQMVYVSDESGGAVMAFSDGTNWRRMTDRVIVS